MATLLDLLARMGKQGDGEALRFTNGLRTWIFAYSDLLARIGALNSYFADSDWRKGDRLLLWGRNRPEWVITFWACLSRGIQVVPIDFHSSYHWVQQVQKEVGARALVYGPKEPGWETLGLEVLSFEQIEKISAVGDRLALEKIAPEDIAEIVYTSGTTGRPKGVLHRHSNICANLRPFEREIHRFRHLARPFQPIRFLNLVPLSHMLGQSSGLFIPILLGGASVFMDEFNPASIVATVRRERVSVLVTVPRLLRSLQRFIEENYQLPTPAPTASGWLGIAQRWWRYRQIHHHLGWKFWANIVGGAPLPLSRENFWNQMGFATLQGYGLTETSPVVTVNHPFSARPGSLGKVLQGQEITLAEDGEILVRGPNVVSGYLREGRVVQVRRPDGWLHTGDIAEMGPDGFLYYKGRKKDLIVTSEGLNVYPEDVESVLNSLQKVRESAVVAFNQSGEDRVHSVVILTDGETDGDGVVGMANRRLEAHQRIRSWSLWPENELPRTTSTGKIKRGEIAAAVNAKQRRNPLQPPQPSVDKLESMLSELSGKLGSRIRDDLRLDEDLGLSSLERVELLSKLENSFGVRLEEESFAGISTVGELRLQLGISYRTPVRDPGSDASSTEETQQAVNPDQEPEGEEIPSISFGVTPPRWNRVLPVRWLRAAAWSLLVLPLFRRYIRVRPEGLASLEQIHPPVLFAANHLSHLDTVAILSALPKQWRHRCAPAMAQGYFLAHFRPQSFSVRERWRRSLEYFLACGLFNAYPLAQRIGGVRQALQYSGELVDSGFCPLVYPEGARSKDGSLDSFKPGIGLLAIRLKIPVVPIHLSGLFEIYSIHHQWPKPGSVEIQFGAPLSFAENSDYRQATQEIEATVRNLGETSQPTRVEKPGGTTRVG